jgi:hypothetical protein
MDGGLIIDPMDREGLENRVRRPADEAADRLIESLFEDGDVGGARDGRGGVCMTEVHKETPCAKHLPGNGLLDVMDNGALEELVPLLEHDGHGDGHVCTAAQSTRWHTADIYMQSQLSAGIRTRRSGTKTPLGEHTKGKELMTTRSLLPTPYSSKQSKEGAKYTSFQNPSQLIHIYSA